MTIPYHAKWLRAMAAGGCLFLAAGPPAQKENLTPGLAELVAAERAFAQMSMEKGIRAAFFEFFAEDGIEFRPGPQVLRERIRSTPAPASPPPVTLRWWPLTGDISAAGDLGGNTGPYVLTDHGPQPRPPQHGFFFSVWKKQADGTWRVAVDIGTQNPVSKKLNRDAPYVRAAPPPKPGATYPSEPGELKRLEREFASQAAISGTDAAYGSFLAPGARLHRNGEFPVVLEKQGWALLHKALTRILVWEPLRAEVAASGELGWTLVRYVKMAGSGLGQETGHAVRVWKRMESGNWKVVADITAPLPAAAP